jgi:hypothetical protein
MRFSYARQLYAKTTNFWRLREIQENKKFVGTQIVMTDDEEGKHEKIRATFKGGEGDISVRGQKHEVTEWESDLTNATFSIWMHRLFPHIMQALDIDEALINLLVDILERVLQRPHNEKIRAEATDLVREIRAGKHLELPLLQENQEGNKDGE